MGHTPLKLEFIMEKILSLLVDLITSWFFWEKPLSGQLRRMVYEKIESSLSEIDTIDPENYEKETKMLRQDLTKQYNSKVFHLFMFEKPWGLLTYRQKLLVDKIHLFMMDALSTDYVNASDLVEKNKTLFLSVFQ